MRVVLFCQQMVNVYSTFVGSLLIVRAVLNVAVNSYVKKSKQPQVKERSVAHYQIIY